MNKLRILFVRQFEIINHPLELNIPSSSSTFPATGVYFSLKYGVFNLLFGVVLGQTLVHAFEQPPEVNQVETFLQQVEKVPQLLFGVPSQLEDRVLFDEPVDVVELVHQSVNVFCEFGCSGLHFVDVFDLPLVFLIFCFSLILWDIYNFEKKFF